MQYQLFTCTPFVFTYKLSYMRTNIMKEQYHYMKRKTTLGKTNKIRTFDETCPSSWTYLVCYQTHYVVLFIYIFLLFGSTDLLFTNRVTFTPFIQLKELKRARPHNFIFSNKNHIFNYLHQEFFTYFILIQ